MVPSIKLLYIVVVLCSLAVLIAGIAIHLELKRHAKAADGALRKVADAIDEIENEQQANKR